MKAKKIAALGLSLMMTMSLCGDVLAADIPVQEEATVVSVEDIAGETEDEEITFAESADEGTGENVGDAETDEEIAVESEDGEEESVEDAFSSEENTAALEDEDIAAYRELDEDNGDEIFSWNETEDGTVTITAYLGKESVVMIPSELKGHAVTTLDTVFSNSSAVTEVIIPDSVQTIKKSFMNWPNLTKITLGSGVTSIDEYTFWDCPKLKTVIVSDKNTAYSAENSILYNKAKTKIEHVFEGISGNIKISDKVEEIEDHQFEDRPGITGITLPGGLKRIGYAAFQNCTGLTSVVIPDSVQEIYMWAFYGCSSLSSVSIGRGVKSIYSPAFGNCASLKSLVIPPEVTWMEQYAVGYYYDSDAGKDVQVRDFVIYGEKGSEAERYANEYGFTFVSKSFSGGTSSDTQNYNIITASNKTMTVSASKVRTWSINAKTKGGAKLSYKSSNAKVKVSSTGKVTIPKKFAGTVKITITASATKAYAKTSKVVTLTVKKAANPMKVTTKNQKIKASAIKKKAKTFTIKVTKAQGKVTYKSSASKYIKVAKNGKVTIRKRTPKGKYKITVTAAGKGIYGKKSKVITITVK
mgnify:CR=1 FL=1